MRPPKPVDYDNIISSIQEARLINLQIDLHDDLLAQIGNPFFRGSASRPCGPPARRFRRRSRPRPAKAVDSFPSLKKGTISCAGNRLRLPGQQGRLECLG